MLFEKQFVPADKYKIWNGGWTAGNNKIAVYTKYGTCSITELKDKERKIKKIFMVLMICMGNEIY